MKRIGLLIFCVVTLALSIGINLAYWSGLDYIGKGSISQSIITSIGGIVIVYIAANYILGTVQSGMLNVFNRNVSFEIALICNYVIPTIYSLIAFIIFIFKVDHQQHWITEILTYFFFIGTTHAVLLKVSKAAKNFKDHQQLVDDYSSYIKTANQFAEGIQNGELTFEKAVKLVDIVQPNDNDIKKVMMKIIRDAKPA